MFLLKAEGAVCKVAAPARPARYSTLGFRPAAGGRCVPRFNSTDLTNSMSYFFCAGYILKTNNFAITKVNEYAVRLGNR